jgi:hypothetical protein
VTRLVRIAAGLGAVTPLGSSVLLGCYMAYRIIVSDLESGSLTRPGITVPGLPFDETDWLLFALSIVIVVIVQLVVAISFTLHAAKDPRLGSSGKALWIVGFFMIGAFALPLYFALLMLRDPPPARVADLQSPPLARDKS